MRGGDRCSWDGFSGPSASDWVESETAVIVGERTDPTAFYIDESILTSSHSQSKKADAD